MSLTKLVHNLFYRYGVFVYRHARWFIIIPLIFITIFMPGMYFRRFDDDVTRLYTPADAPSVVEASKYRQFRDDQSNASKLLLSEQFELVIESSTNLLTSERMAEVIRIDAHIRLGIRNGTYQSFCGTLCSVNAELLLFFQMYADSPTYPYWNFLGKQKFNGRYLYGVETYENSTQIQNLHSVKMTYGTECNSTKQVENWNLWLEDVQNFVTAESTADFTISYATQEMLNKATRKSAQSINPFIGLSVLVLILFTLATQLRWSRRRHTIVSSSTIKRRHLLWLCACAVLIPLMSIPMTTGILTYCHLSIQAICNVAIFLILAVGVDDVYLLLYANAKQSSKKNVTQATEENLEERCATSVANSAASVTLTSVTNVLAFLVGAISPTPAVSLFCSFTAISLTVCYILHMTIFTALYMVALRASTNKKPSTVMPQISSDFTPADEKCNESYCGSVGLSNKENAVEKRALQKLPELWSKFCLSTTARIISAFIYVVYIYVAQHGWAISTVNMNVSNLLSSGTIVYDYYVHEKHYARSGIERITLLFNATQLDFRNHTSIKHVTSVMSAIETSSSQMLGEDSTVCWLHDYLGSAMVDDHDSRNFYDNIQSFLNTTGNRRFRQDIIFENDCTSHKCLTSFLCHTYYRGSSNWKNMIEILADWRQIISKFNNNFGTADVTVLHKYAFMADQIASVMPTAIKTIIGTMITTAILCAIFLPNIACVSCAILAVTSINYGVFGFMTLWGISLDPITLSGLLMSIGFSVDFTAHIIYHYYASPDDNQSNDQSNDISPAVRLQHTFEAVALPTVQAAISSVLVMSVIALHGSYIMTVFCKIITLIAIIGLIHALFIIPVIAGGMARDEQGSVQSVVYVKRATITRVNSTIEVIARAEKITSVSRFQTNGRGTKREEN